MFSSRKLFLAFAMACATFGFHSQADAQQVRYFVKQSTGLYEVLAASTGGKFVGQPTGEKIRIPGVGDVPVVGRTDRASRGETVVTQLTGSGRAQVTVSYTPGGGRPVTIFAGPLGLPFVLAQMVSMSSDFDNLTVVVTQNGKSTSRRLPIGRRQ